MKHAATSGFPFGLFHGICDYIRHQAREVQGEVRQVTDGGPASVVEYTTTKTMASNWDLANNSVSQLLTIYFDISSKWLRLWKTFYVSIIWVNSKYDSPFPQYTTDPVP